MQRLSIICFNYKHCFFSGRKCHNVGRRPRVSMATSLSVESSHNIIKIMCYIPSKMQVYTCEVKLR